MVISSGPISSHPISSFAWLNPSGAAVLVVTLAIDLLMERLMLTFPAQIGVAQVLSVDLLTGRLALLLSDQLAINF